MECIWIIIEPYRWHCWIDCKDTVQLSMNIHDVIRNTTMSMRATRLFDVHRLYTNRGCACYNIWYRDCGFEIVDMPTSPEQLTRYEKVSETFYIVWFFWVFDCQPKGTCEAHTSVQKFDMVLSYRVTMMVLGFWNCTGIRHTYQTNKFLFVNDWHRLLFNNVLGNAKTFVRI